MKQGEDFNGGSYPHFFLILTDGCYAAKNTAIYGSTYEGNEISENPRRSVYEILSRLIKQDHKGDAE